MVLLHLVPIASIDLATAQWTFHHGFLISFDDTSPLIQFHCDRSFGWGKKDKNKRTKCEMTMQTLSTALGNVNADEKNSKRATLAWMKWKTWHRVTLLACYLHSFFSSCCSSNQPGQMQTLFFAPWNVFCQSLPLQMSNTSECRTICMELSALFTS